MNKIPALLLVVLFSCNNGQDKATPAPQTEATTPASSEPQFQSKTIVLEEFFSDSVTIGRKTLNKIELSKFKDVDSNFVIIRFFSRQGDGWQLKNELKYLKDGMLPCDTKVSDFNNDGLKDLTYVSEYSSRSGNETRKLFIYDKSGDSLVLIKNSEEFPNLLYNSTLNCIDAFFVFAGCSTIFLKLEGDKLRRFATVDLFDGLTVMEFDKNGNEKILQQGPTEKTGYIRFKNYKPLQEYEHQ